MGKIVILDENTANKIAAGEVVERPASVVKEMIENSIDAGAESITIEIKKGGISYIRITDNGSGIDDDDVEIVDIRFGNIDGMPGQTLNELFNGRGVKSGHNPVTGLHRLKRNHSFDRTNLTNDDPIGALAEGGSQQIKHAHFAARTFARRMACHFLYPVLVWYLYFWRVFNRDDFGIGFQECIDRVQCCGLT